MKKIPKDIKEKLFPYNEAFRAIIRKNVQKIFRDSVNEVFETGMESDFERKLLKMIFHYDYLTITAIEEILERKIDLELYAETMRLIGFCSDRFTRNMRFNLLIKGLNHNSPIVRDSASLGLADFDDKAAITHLTEAISRESYNSLCKDYEQVIMKLRFSI